MRHTDDVRILYTTTDSADNAYLLAETIVKDKLAACCTIIPGAISYFEWEDNIERRHEYVLMIKTKAGLLDELELRLTELHNDSVPELITINVNDISEGYMNWLINTTK